MDGGGFLVGVRLEEVVAAAESALVLEGVGYMWALHVCGNHTMTFVVYTCTCTMPSLINYIYSKFHVSYNKLLCLG